MVTSQKSARSVHLNDLATYFDAPHKKARTEHDMLMSRSLRRVS